MLLALDIGNTSIHIGLFEGESLDATWRIGVETEKLPDEYGVLLLRLLVHAAARAEGHRRLHHRLRRAAADPHLREASAASYFDIEPLVVGTGCARASASSTTTRASSAPTASSMSSRRSQLYGPPPLIMVDFGTATVFDAVNAQGDYLGGAIAPGIGIACEALFSARRSSTGCSWSARRAPSARTRSQAMQSGMLFGYVGLMEGMVARFKKELGGSARVVATGGWANWSRRRRQCIDVVDQNLTLDGLRLIHEHEHAAGRERHVGPRSAGRTAHRPRRDGLIAATRRPTSRASCAQAGALVEVVMTPAAQRFVAPLTFQSLTGAPVLVDMYDPQRRGRGARRTRARGGCDA